jgi:AcrR family transcriptional regulator
MTRAGLSRPQIVATAIALADRDGLAALTLRGLASELGVHVTSLYNHVPTLDAVLDDMAAALVTEANLPTRIVSWEAWVRGFATRMRAAARRHPGAFEVLHRRPVQGPDAALAFESALAAFAASGFESAEAYSALKATIHAVLGIVLEELAAQRDPALRTDMRRLSRERFPHAHAASAATSRSRTWTYLVDVLVAGIEALHARPVRRRRAARPSVRASRARNVVR